VVVVARRRTLITERIGTLRADRMSSCTSHVHNAESDNWLKPGSEYNWGYEYKKNWVGFLVENHLSFCLMLNATDKNRANQQSRHL